MTTFSRNLSDGIALRGNNTTLSLVPHLPTKDSNATLSSAAALTADATVKRIDRKTVAYEYDSKTTIEYSLTYTGFKEDIVVSEYTGQTEYEFTLYTNGLTLKEVNGAFCLMDGSGVVKATLGDIIIFTADEKNNTMGELSAKTVTKNQEYLLTISVDAAYLAAPETTYPIRIDPTVELSYDNNGSGAIQDVTLNSLQGSSGTSGSLLVGLRETYGKSRILMKFPGLNLNTLGSNVIITEATVELRDLMCETTGLEVSCYVFTGNVWDESTANWSNVSPDSFSTPCLLIRFLMPMVLNRQRHTATPLILPRRWRAGEPGITIPIKAFCSKPLLLWRAEHRINTKRWRLTIVRPISPRCP